MFSRTRVFLYSYQARSSQFFRLHVLQKASSAIAIKSTGLEKATSLSRRCITMGTRELPVIGGRRKWPITTLLFAGAIGGAISYGTFVREAHAEKAEEDNASLLELELHTQMGGEKNLPIARFLVDDPDAGGISDTRPRLVILGSGWGVRIMLIALITL